MTIIYQWTTGQFHAIALLANALCHARFPQFPHFVCQAHQHYGRIPLTRG